MRTVSETRFACHSCGACCQGYRFGPVEPAVVQGLVDRGVEEAWPPAAQGWRIEQDGQTWFRDVDGACVFLQPDKRCAIHGLWGAEAKPGFCREFPFNLARDGSETVVTVRGDCAGLYKSFSEGDPVPAAEIEALPRLHPVRDIGPDTVLLLPGVGVDLAVYRQLEAALLRLAGPRAEAPTATVARLRGGLERAMNRALPPAPPGHFEEVAATARLALRQSLQPERGLPWQRRIHAELDAMLEREPAGAPDESGWLNVLLRNQLMSRAFLAHGSLAEGLGLFALGSSICVGATPEERSASWVRWSRLTEMPSTMPVLRAMRPALMELFRSAA